MRQKILILAIWLALVPVFLPKNGIKAQQVLFDFDWRFHRGGAMGAENPDFPDSSWRKVDLPHDWSIEDLPGTFSPFDPDAAGQVSTGFTAGGTAWYRKSFTIPGEEKGQRAFIMFDGIYMNADIWLNGQLLGNHPYGYTPFWYDITGYLDADKVNVFAVQVKNEGQTSRWYSGSGIYRHVWIRFTGPVYIAQWGTCITTPEVSETAARVNIKTTIVNQSKKMAGVTLVTRYLDVNGKQQGQTESFDSVAPGKHTEFSQDFRVSNPDLWSTDSPHLYSAVSEIIYDGRSAGISNTKFGIRSLSFSTDKGFLLNSKPLKLKGGCVHNDNGPLGSRTYDRAEERRVELLKANGYNAIRCAHNPPSASFLDACDRLGMLVIDEAFDMWIRPNNPNDYHLYFRDWWQRDLESMILRDRNHPGVIMWSIGNEISGMETPEIAAIARELADFVRKTDPTRPVTAAVNSVNEKKDPFFSALDIAGYNYARDHYNTDHVRVPERIIFCTESYPLESFEYWTEALKYPWVLGDFVWTAFDHIGEASIGWRGYYQEKDFYPWNLAYCGDIDICGWKRPQSFYRDVLWKKDQVSVFVKPPEPSFPENPKRESWSIWHWQDVIPDWNWNGYEGRSMEVTVYSSCEKVELFLNQKSLGQKETNLATRFTATYLVPYQPGVLKVTGISNKKVIAESTLQTALHPSKIQLKADRTRLKADNQDLSYITVELTDDKGIRNPKAENRVNFTITGPGSIVGVGNGNPVSTESCQLPYRKAWRGRCMVIIKSGNEKGNILVQASADGIESSQIVIKTDLE